MNYGKPHQDMMDASRVVVPRSSDGKNLSCAVYFRSKNGRLDFSGMTELSINLFTGTKMDPRMPERLGFMLVSD